jgi:hypothetical protein
VLAILGCQHKELEIVLAELEEKTPKFLDKLIQRSGKNPRVGNQKIYCFPKSPEKYQNSEKKNLLVRRESKTFAVPKSPILATVWLWL